MIHGVIILFTRLLSFAVVGVEGHPVTVELDLAGGLPAFEVVGLPDPAVREARERVRAALHNSGFDFPARRITVNLAPAHTRKEGPGFDLPIALALLAASGQVEARRLEGLGAVGELSLDGALRPVRGALAMALAARQAGVAWLAVPPENAGEATLAGVAGVAAPARLADLAAWLKGTGPRPEPPAGAAKPAPAPGAGVPDLADVRGQAAARRAVEIAAAGGHNLLLVGPPGAGKSMLARRLPGILPSLSEEEALEVARIAGVWGEPVRELALVPPFRAPHHSCSLAALLGGGPGLRPGELTLAHRGALFLDELPEFPRHALEALRQPLEDGEVVLGRARATVRFPARCMLVGAANPCPCGWRGEEGRACTCTPYQVERYAGRLSGPLLDRFDLQVRVGRVPLSDLADDEAGEPSAVVRTRVAAARARQRARFAPLGLGSNAQLQGTHLRHLLPLAPESRRLLQRAFQVMAMSLRAYDRILKVAWTIADLAGAATVDPDHVAEALQYRLAHWGGNAAAGE